MANVQARQVGGPRIHTDFVASVGLNPNSGAAIMSDLTETQYTEMSREVIALIVFAGPPAFLLLWPILGWSISKLQRSMIAGKIQQWLDRPAD